MLRNQVPVALLGNQPVRGQSFATISVSQQRDALAGGNSLYQPVKGQLGRR